MREHEPKRTPSTNISIQSEDLARIKAAAAIEHRSVSNFIVLASAERADRVLERASRGLKP